MSPKIEFPIWYYYKISIFDIGLLLTILPISNEYQKKLRWYQTPFIFLFFCWIESLQYFFRKKIYEFEPSEPFESFEPFQSTALF